MMMMFISAFQFHTLFRFNSVLLHDGFVLDDRPEPFWDRPGIMADRNLVEFSLSSPLLRASFLTSLAPHTGDWLFALLITSCGLRLDDEAVRVAVGLQLGLNLCVPHQCRCGSAVDARGLHSFVCKRAPGKTSIHHALNDLVVRAFASAGIPATTWIDQVGWEKARWANSGPLAKRETLVMGRHGDLFTGRFVR